MATTTNYAENLLNKKQTSFDRIKAADNDTFFVMVCSIPVNEYDPEDQFCFGMEAHRVRRSGDYHAMCEYYDNLMARAKALCKDSETADFFMREEGRDYCRFVFFNGDRAVMTTLCGKQKALGLSF